MKGDKNVHNKHMGRSIQLLYTGRGIKKLMIAIAIVEGFVIRERRRERQKSVKREEK